MEDTAVWVLELEDSIFKDINNLEDKLEVKQDSPAWELTADGFPWNDGIFLEQLVPKAEELSPMVGISPALPESHIELPVSPLESAENLQAIPSDFFVSPTKEPVSSVVVETRASVTSPAEEKSLDMSYCNLYTGDSSPDAQRAEDSDSSSQRRKRRRYEEEPSANPSTERSRRNAIIAKRNRERKKQMLETLQTSVQELTIENTRLSVENAQLKRKVATLESEMSKLKSALARSSSLSSFFMSLKCGDSMAMEPKAFRQI